MTTQLKESLTLTLRNFLKLRLYIQGASSRSHLEIAAVFGLVRSRHTVTFANSLVHFKTGAHAVVAVAWL